ncbi:MAG: pyruvate kinase alpha/beta domain-containing protein [Bacillota bacterium]|nr:pyruvate kinase alpha/beta domain-containing protein [Bacillota bacterium]
MKYFDTPGPKNTEGTFEEVMKVAQEQGIKQMVVASTSGRTAEYLLGKGFDVTVVTHQAGYKEAGMKEISDEMVEKLTAGGMHVLTTTHLLGGADRALNYKFGGIYPAEIIAHTLRMFGQGAKVCVEVATMAMDAGHLRAGEEIIAIGGSGKGADTAMIMVPAHSQYLFDTDIREIICMPRGHKK